MRRLRTMNVHKSLLWRIVSACAIPLILYCSPIIFPGLLNKTSPLLKSVINFQWCSSQTHICRVLISQHFNSCTRLSTSISMTRYTPSTPCLANAPSTSNTRSSFKLLRYRTSLYRNSHIPSLAHHLVNPKQEVDPLSSNLF